VVKPQRDEDGRVEDDVFEATQEWDGVPKAVTQTKRDQGQNLESTEEPEPIIKDEDPNAERDESEQIDSTTEAAAMTNAVAKVEELDVVPEVREVDHLLEVKAWAMQSPGWKMLNVIFETLSDE
jgi:hypothetical protein